MDRRWRLGWRAGLLVAPLLASLAVGLTTAAAVAPGANGPIFFDGSGEIYRINPNGTGQINLTNTGAGEERPSATGDGTAVTFQAFDANSWEIWRMDGNGANRQQVTTDPSTVVNFEPGFSPDGSKIVFMRQLPADPGMSFPGSQDLWQVNPGGGGETNLTNTPYPGDGTHSDECCGEYSPDGSKIVYANGFNSDPGEAESNDIWLMNANGSGQHGLTGPHDAPIQDVGPSWSPDGLRIAFARFGTGNGSDGLYLIDSDGTDLTPVMNGAAHVTGNNPTFSPDGTLIAYSTGGRIATVPVGGGAPVAVSPSGINASYSSWANLGGSPPDTTPPQTTITSGPPVLMRRRSATFGFTASEAGSAFACKLDGGGFAPCTSPRAYAGLGDGTHTFSVRATDAASNTDPSPATRSFRVDGTAPQTTITSGPSGKTTKKKASFAFQSSEPGSSFKCKLDGAGLTTCSSPVKYSGLKKGKHVFSVAATDKAGNPDSSAATRSFKVKPKRKKHKRPASRAAFVPAG